MDSESERNNYTILWFFTLLNHVDSNEKKCSNRTLTLKIYKSALSQLEKELYPFDGGQSSSSSSE